MPDRANLPFDMSALAGKSVVITGAARGIGAAAARFLAEAGARLTLAGRPSAALSEVAAETGGQIAACDVTRFAEVEAAVAAAVAAYGRIDVLINNAGIIDPIAPLAEGDPELWARQIAVNVNGVYHGMRAAMPVMLAQGAGTILTVGSGAAHTPQIAWSAYCASKAAAFMLTRNAHLEAGEVLRILSISPGTVATDMQRQVKDSQANAHSRLDWSVHATPEAVAQALAWMCLPEADEFRGGEVSLRDPATRARIGLAA